jgi:Ca2+-transporting ATPase
MQNLKYSAHKGLADSEVQVKRRLFGANKLTVRNNKIKDFFLTALGEPMLIILLACGGIYFALGEAQEGFIMIAAITIISAISFFQERKSNNALKGLREITSPSAEVVRNGKREILKIEDLVKDDIIFIEEGKFVPADIRLMEANDISVDESLLTGESFAVKKTSEDKENKIFKGSYIIAGQGIAIVEAVGDSTMLGKLGKDIQEINKDKSPLQKQVTQFVKYMSIAGLVAFFFIWIHHFLETGNLLQSLLSGLTIAMSVFPEEIPVAITIFMALGAWEMVKEDVLIKDPRTLETLGSATVICVDKTGTLTENKMKVSALWSGNNPSISYLSSGITEKDKEVLSYAMWASEPEPFDPMEKAIHEAYLKYINKDERKDFSFIHEYPLSGTPPAMTHAYEGRESKRIIACKGGPETIFAFCKIKEEDRKKFEQEVKKLASEGMRILAVAKTEYSESKFPENQKDFDWQFLGLIALSDPPKKNIDKVIEEFYKAGINIKMITGDIAETASSIAKQVGIRTCDYVTTGKEIQEMSEERLSEALKSCNVFARMLPESKLKLINQLKKNGEIVCMTGDGINDVLALKASHIGIAMGKKGTEIAKESSSIILMKDDLSGMITAIAAGRKIYSNLKKAILYILSIHIPIIGIMILPLLLGWKYESIFSPIHIIFFELLMGPICSIAYEKEPMEENLMNNKPRKLHKNLFSLNELSGSIIQGLIIFIGVMSVLKFSINSGYSEALARSLVFITLIASNVFLALTDRSRKKSFFYTLKFKNYTLYILLFTSILCMLLIIRISFLRSLFQVEIPETFQILICSGIAILSVGWFEIAKIINKKEA